MNNKDELISYYEKEFDMLKDAHFQTSQKIISFFQFALLIFSAPIALLTSNQITRLVLGCVFVVIGLIEVLIIAYLTSLRVEALLYARQINRIRSVLYSNGVIGSKKEDIHNRKILFSQDKKPDYRDTNQFIFIVLVLGIFSAFYFSFGLYKLITHFYGFKCIYWICAIVILSGLLMLGASYSVYKVVTIKEENGTTYYKQIIGVDIDGVLNKHEESFVAIFKKLTGKTITCSDIKSLPVSISTNISREEEHSVFETKEYWEIQELATGAKEYLIQEICNTLGYKLYIFTWRNWNVHKNLEGERVTFDIEKYTKKYRIKYFVEDSLKNAEKLSHICEYVFLIDHYYNQTETLPYNIIRVSNWKDISEWIKKIN